jgi:hypothetical protein
MKLDFPDPEFQMRKTKSPFSIERLIFLRTFFGPYAIVVFLSSMRVI